MCKTPAVSDTLSLQFGIVGPHSLAEESQHLVHQWTGSKRPRGWDYQLRNEIGVNLVFERRWRLFGCALLQKIGIDLVLHAGVGLGNVQT